jgi:hypothetical protein
MTQNRPLIERSLHFAEFFIINLPKLNAIFVDGGCFSCYNSIDRIRERWLPFCKMGKACLKRGGLTKAKQEQHGCLTKQRTTRNHLGKGGNSMVIALAQHGNGNARVQLFANTNGYSIKTMFKTWTFSGTQCASQAISMYDSLCKSYMSVPENIVNGHL